MPRTWLEIVIIYRRYPNNPDVVQVREVFNPDDPFYQPDTILGEWRIGSWPNYGRFSSCALDRALESAKQHIRQLNPNGRLAKLEREKENANGYDNQ